MSATDLDHNLLFGILALQNDLVDRQALIGAFDQWLHDKGRPLGQVLVDRQALSDTEYDLVAALTEKCLARHGGDVLRSLAARSSLGSEWEEAASLPDAELRSALARVVSNCSLGGASAILAGPSIAATLPLPAGGPLAGTARFTILRPHARGGLGEVFLAEDEDLHRPVALKQIQRRHADNPASRSRFLVEAEITARLEHPGIVPVYALGTDSDNRPYYAMRFVHGDTLHEAIRVFFERDGTFASLEFRKLLARFLAVCQAIDYANSRGIVHRDLKPQNVMLGQYGETLVVDWGLAKAIAGGEVSEVDSLEEALADRPAGEAGSAGDTIDLAAPRTPDHGPLRPRAPAESDRTRMGQALGTPAYMSPEQAQGRLDLLGPATDVFGLGAVLYSLLTGRPPLEGDNQQAILQRAAEGQFRPARQVRSRVPRPLESICTRAMSVKPTDRYASARALADDVERWLADEPVAAHREESLERAWRWLRRRRAWAAAAAAALLLVTAVSIGAAVLVNFARQDAETALGAEKKSSNAALIAKDQAKRAIDRYVNAVQQNELLKDDRFNLLRKQLLSDALAYYEAFARDHPDDAAQRERVAEALMTVARISQDSGSVIDAIAAYQKAAAIYEQSAQDDPKTLSHQHQLGICVNDLGLLQSETGDEVSARANVERALQIRRRLAEKEPSFLYQRKLIDSYLNTGLCQSNAGELKTALETYNSAIALATDLQKSNSEPRLRHTLASLHNNRASIERRLGDSQAALASYEAAGAISRPLAYEFPGDPLMQRDLARNHLNLSTVRADLGQFQAALDDAETVLKLAEKLVQEHSHVIEYRLYLVSGYRARGRARTGLGQPKEALADAGQALETALRLAADQPAVVTYQVDLAECHVELANRQWTSDEHAAAKESYRRAIGVIEKLAESHPDNVDYQRSLAERHDRLGTMLQLDGENDAALASRQQALDIGRRIAGSPSANDNDRHRLGRLHHNLGWLVQGMGRLDEARESYLQGIAVYERLLTDDSEGKTFRGDFANTFANFGYLEADAGNKQKAAEWFARAQQTAEPLAKVEAGNSLARRMLFNASWGRAQALADLGQHAEAVDDFRLALEFDPGGNSPELRTAIAVSLAGAGETQLAADDALALELPADVAPKTLYALGCVLARLSATANQETAERCAARSIELLRHAQAAGYFQSAEARERLRTDLGALAESGPFRELIEESAPAQQTAADP